MIRVHCTKDAQIAQCGLLTCAEAHANSVNVCNVFALIIFGAQVVAVVGSEDIADYQCN